MSGKKKAGMPGFDYIIDPEATSPKPTEGEKARMAAALGKYKPKQLMNFAVKATRDQVMQVRRMWVKEARGLVEWGYFVKIAIDQGVPKKTVHKGETHTQLGLPLED